MYNYLLFNLLQAFDLGVPVLARHIPGNTYLIEHNKTGLLFDTPKVHVLTCHVIISVEAILPCRVKTCSEFNLENWSRLIKFAKFARLKKSQVKSLA